MAISVVQRNTGTDTLGSTGGVTVAFGSNNTAGNAIIALGWVEASANSGLSTPTDTQGNTYSQILSINNGLVSIGLVVWISYSVNAGANTVTMNDGFNIANLHIYEVSGLAPNSAFDKSAFQYQFAQTSLNSGTTAVTSNNVELLIGAFGLGLSSAPTWTAGSGYSNLTAQNQTFLNTATEEQIVSSQASYSATASVLANLNGNSLAAVLTFSSTFDINVSDSTATSETVNPNLASNVKVSDSTVTSESRALFNQSWNVSVSDATVTLNPATVFSDLDPQVSDTTTTSNPVTIASINLISVSDSTMTSENVSFIYNLLLAILDTNTTIEDTFVEIPIAGTLEVTAEDNAYIIDSAQLSPSNIIAVNDLSLVIEGLQLNSSSFINISDTTVTSENINTGQGQPVVVSDTTVTSENVKVVTSVIIVRTIKLKLIIIPTINFSIVRKDI